MLKKKLIFCRSKVSASNIRRETRDGVEHIIITSFTLPPDIVMNRGLYPAEEIDKSFKSLNRKFAPIEHPEINGEFISAADPEAVINFFGGAWNDNVEKADDGRIKVDKIINVQEALKTDRGKRLLDRIEGMENGSDSRPIHTSVGVFLEVEPLDKPQVNAHGDEFDWIAREMIIDHDAILLDSIGAATPSKGVGIGVNKEKIDVEFIYDLDKPVIGNGNRAKDMRANTKHGNLSFQDIEHKLWHLLNLGKEKDFFWIEAVFDETFVYHTPSGEFFRSHYNIDENDNITISDTRIPVERVVSYPPINQPANEDEDTTMRDEIIAFLEGLGMTVNADISDADLKVQYDEAKKAEVLAANKNDSSNDDSAADSELATTVKNQATEIDQLKANAQDVIDAEIDKKIKVIISFDKYSKISESALKAIHTNNAEEFETMYNESIPSFGIGSTALETTDADDEFRVSTDVDKLPK